MSKTPKAPRLTSEALHSLTSKKNAKELKEFLKTDLYPAIDCLPAAQQTILLDALAKNSKKVEAPHLVEFDTRSRSISAGIQALERNVAYDPIEEWEEQGMMIMEVLGNLLRILWKVGIEMCREHALVHDMLSLCYLVYECLRSTNSRFEFSDLNSAYGLEIEDLEGNVVYTAETLQDAILWTWCELLISAFVDCPNDNMAKTLVADIKQKSLTKEILERLDNETITTNSNSSQWDGDDDGDWQNAHWTPEMRAVAPKLRVLLARG